MDIQRNMWVVLGVTLFIISVSGRGYEFDPDYLIPPKCKPCDATPCPQLTYCVGKVLKDHCGCCLRCSSDLFQPDASDPSPVAEIEEKETVAQTKVDVCKQRACPKFKICLINQQGLPICTCPSVKVCNKRGKRANQLMETSICGSDGFTYSSKCHLRLANCNSIRRIKRLHTGPCLKDKNALDKEDEEDDGAGVRRYSAGYRPEKQMTKKEEKARLKAMKRAKRKKMKKRQKMRRLRKKEKKGQKEKGRNRRRSKRLNTVFSPYSSHYDFLLRKHTNWSHNQIRKSRI